MKSERACWKKYKHAHYYNVIFFWGRVLSSIFKYFPMREEFFSNRLLRASGNRSLNDPFEARPSISYFESLANQTGWARFSASKKDLEEYVQGLPMHSPWRTFGLSQFDSFGIISFTKKQDNLLMWSHYADEHRGMVVEFDSEHAIFHSIYKDEGIPRAGKLSEVSYEIKRRSEFGGFEDPFFEKPKCWGYEEEWRLVVPFSKADKRLIAPGNLKNLTESGLIENAEVEHFSESLVNISNCSFMGSLPRIPEVMFMYEIPPEAITGVIFGALADDEAVDVAIKEIREVSELCHVNVSKAEICLENYAVNVVKI